MHLPGVEDMRWKATGAEEEQLYKSVHLGPDSPSYTYIACRHCHIASGGPIRIQMAPGQPAGSPIADRPRHRIGIPREASRGPAIP